MAAAKRRTSGEPAELSMIVRAKGYEAGPITVEEANEMLTKNNANRPVKPANVKTLALELLRGTWELNGEPIILDPEGNIGNGQHSLMALVKAEQMRQADPDRWKKYGIRGPLTLDKIIVTGIPIERFDTLDIAAKRSHGDVLYRQHLFAEGTYKPNERKQLSNDLAVAARLVWLRSSGQVVSDAPKFPLTEMLRFIYDGGDTDWKNHKALIDCVVHVYTTDIEQGRAISQRISRGYMAGMMYLFACAEGPENFDDRMLKAEHAVLDFATGTEMGKGDPLYELRELLVQMRETSSTRDEKVSVIVKAFKALDNGEKIAKRSDLKPKKSEGAPRFGGLDTEIEPPEAEEPEATEDVEEPEAEVEKPPSRPRRPKRAANTEAA